MQLSTGAKACKKNEFMPYILNALDHSMSSKQGIKDNVRVCLIKWDSILHSYFMEPSILTRENAEEVGIEVDAKNSMDKQGLVESLAIRRVREQPARYAVASYETGTIPTMEVREWHEAAKSKEVNRMKPEEKKAFKALLKANPGEAAPANEVLTDTVGPAVTDAPGTPGADDANAESGSGTGTGNALDRAPHSLKMDAERLGAEGASEIKAGLIPWFVTAKTHSDIAGEASTMAGKGAGITLSLALTGGTFYLVYMTTYNAKWVNEQCGGFGVAIVLCIAQNVIPQMVKMLVQFEGWTKAEDVLKQLLWRTYILKMSNLFITVIALKSSEARTACPEADMASQLLNLIFIEFVSNCLTTVGTGVGTFYATGEKIPLDHNTVAQFYIDMNYRQALIWTAIPYLPIAPLYGAITQNIMFYTMMWTFGHFYQAADIPFEDNTGTGTLMALMASIGIAFFPQADWLMDSPGTCGPVTTTTKVAGEISTRYEAAVFYVYNKSPTVVQEIFVMVLNPMVIYSSIIVLILMINLLFQYITGLQDELKEAEQSEKVLMHMWRKEVKNNKVNAGMTPRRDEN